MAIADHGQSPLPPSEPNYGDICDLAVQLNLALLESDILKLASKYLMSTLPSILFTRFEQNLTSATAVVTIRPGEILERTQYARSPPAAIPLAESLPSLRPPNSYQRGHQPDSNLGVSWDERKAASVFVAPMQSKGKVLGTLTIGSSTRNAFAGRLADVVNIVAAMVAPYLHIHDLRQHLEVKQTCLIDCLPATVATHMLEKRAMGMTPVQPIMQSGDLDAASSSSEEPETSGRLQL